MKLGEETWKWALVICLLSVFLLLGNQAWKSFNNPEDQFEPPDDYMKGDSFDQDHHDPGPGAGQPIEVPSDATGSNLVAPISPEAPVSEIPVEHLATSAWDQIKDPSKP
ncbi:MAG: hypothetical protein WA705_07750 [Candidatus Ozemobacteraceae bacterium]